MANPKDIVDRFQQIEIMLNALPTKEDKKFFQQRLTLTAHVSEMTATAPCWFEMETKEGYKGRCGGVNVSVVADPFIDPSMS